MTSNEDREEELNDLQELVGEEHWVEFRRFVETGEASNAFLHQFDGREDWHSAYEEACRRQVSEISGFVESLKSFAVETRADEPKVEVSRSNRLGRYWPTQRVVVAVAITACFFTAMLAYDYHTRLTEMNVAQRFAAYAEEYDELEDVTSRFAEMHRLNDENEKLSKEREATYAILDDPDGSPVEKLNARQRKLREIVNHRNRLQEAYDYVAGQFLAGRFFQTHQDLYRGLSEGLFSFERGMELINSQPYPESGLAFLRASLLRFSPTRLSEPIQAKYVSYLKEAADDIEAPWSPVARAELDVVQMEDSAPLVKFVCGMTEEIFEQPDDPRVRLWLAQRGAAQQAAVRLQGHGYPVASGFLKELEPLDNAVPRRAAACITLGNMATVLGKDHEEVLAGLRQVYARADSVGVPASQDGLVVLDNEASSRDVENALEVAERSGRFPRSVDAVYRSRTAITDQPILTAYARNKDGTLEQDRAMYERRLIRRTAAKAIERITGKPLVGEAD